MLINYNGKRMTCNIDWLSFSVKTKESNPEIMCPDGYRLELLPGNNIFANRFIMRDLAGNKLITCLWNPYSKVLDQRLMTCQVANSQLYIDGGINRCFALLQQCVDCSFNAVSRVDICLDFVASDRDYKIIRKLSSGAMYVERKREGSQFWHETTIQKGSKSLKVRQVHCLSWGSKTTEIKCKLYYKSREQGLLSVPKNGTPIAPEKPYIVDEWISNKMDTKRVWRLEFSLCGAGQLIWDGKVITLEDVSSPYWYCRVFAGLYRTRFVVRKNQGRRTLKHNDDDIVSFLDLPFDRLPLEWITYAKRDPLTPDGEVLKIIRHLILQTDSDVIRANPQYLESLYDLCNTMCQQSHAYPYVQRLLGKSLRDYFNDIVENSGVGIYDTIPQLSKSLS